MGTHLMPKSTATRGTAMMVDHQRTAERQRDIWHQEADNLRRRLIGLEELIGIGVAAPLRHHANLADEAAAECMFAYRDHIAQIEDDHRRKLEALQAELSDARVQLARALVLIRDLDDRIRGRRLKAFDDLTARSLEFIADHQGPPF